jgi:hypothetical protein
MLPDAMCRNISMEISGMRGAGDGGNVGHDKVEIEEARREKRSQAQI